MKRVIIDTDIGTDVDDAMALALALSLPELEIVGITTVHADAPLRARIATAILRQAGREDIPVVAGASLPLQMPLPPNFIWMPKLRGHEGVGILTEAERAPSTQPTQPNAATDDAAHFIIEQAAARPGELSLITIGAQTNIGRALLIEPRLAGWLRNITIMGGTVFAERFPFPPMLEVNLNADPEASRLVFASGIPLTLVPMEVTTQVYLTPDQRAALRSQNLPLTNALAEMMERMFDGLATLSSEAGLSDDFYQGRTFMHDPLAVACCAGSALVTMQEMHVRHEVIERVVRTVPYLDREPNMQVCIDVDAPAFVSFWMDCVSTLARQSN